MLCGTCEYRVYVLKYVKLCMQDGVSSVSEPEGGVSGTEVGKGKGGGGEDTEGDEWVSFMYVMYV